MRGYDDIKFVFFIFPILGKHRKHPGGRGNAGGMHHHRINFDKYHPGYFGKVGMRNFHMNRNHTFCPTMNLDTLWSLVGEENMDRAAKQADKIPVIDIVQYVSIKISCQKNFLLFLVCVQMMTFFVRAVLSKRTKLHTIM